jgi:pantoate--beta-alanine ligase
VTQWVEESFKTNTSFKLEYFQIADETTLKPCLRKPKKYRAFIAVTVNNIRLIDTISLN